MTDATTIVVGLVAGTVLFFVLGVGALPLVLIAAVVANLWPRPRRCECRRRCDCDN